MSHTSQLAVAAIVHYAADPKHANVPPKLAKVAGRALSLLKIGRDPSDALLEAARRTHADESAARKLVHDLYQFGTARLAA